MSDNSTPGGGEASGTSTSGTERSATAEEIEEWDEEHDEPHPVFEVDHRPERQNVGTEHPEVVCLCGSTRFKETYREENERLTMEGKIVLSCGVFGHADDVSFSEGEKEMLDALHKRKIDLADRIHVINVDGYVGDSTQSEIEYARETDTEVTYLKQPVATDGGTDTSGTKRFEKTTRREIHRCSECDEFELEKKFSGVAGTPGEEEYDRIEAPDNCHVCGGEIECEVVA
ncbi:hypothetical protein [Halostella sp. PRR32]|uniref:hypothetical protein n=1 Tax=Halostella sp. PRR32 TaxID=3098147 RepID=UPI002B1DDEF1|nr:hypothetical protein [Halostella sp. PRR32]